MSLHIKYSHQCRHCSAYYIPFAEYVLCPNCWADEKEVFPAFISQAANSARFNLQTQGYYEPEAWYIGSFTDHILHRVFLILEEHRIRKDEFTIEQIARHAVDTMDFGEQQYLREHLYQIVIMVKR